MRDSAGRYASREHAFDDDAEGPGLIDRPRVAEDLVGLGSLAATPGGFCTSLSRMRAMRASRKLDCSVAPPFIVMPP